MRFMGLLQYYFIINKSIILISAAILAQNFFVSFSVVFFFPDKIWLSKKGTKGVSKNQFWENKNKILATERKTD